MKGFTLIELMITVAIAGVLMAVLIPAANRMDEEKLESVAAVETVYTEQRLKDLDDNHYGNKAYWLAISEDRSTQYQPVCVHGIPFFETQGHEGRVLIPLGDQRGQKAASRFWQACYGIGEQNAEERQR